MAAQDHGPRDRVDNGHGNDRMVAPPFNRAEPERQGPPNDRFGGWRPQPGQAPVRQVTYTNDRGRQIMVPEHRDTRVLTRRGDLGWGGAETRRFYDGCPPGLARKYNGCNPPGLVRDYRPEWGWQSADWYRPAWRGDDYRYYDGYIVRASGTRILSYIPLLGGALLIGEAWPGDYQPMAVPTYYDSYYDLGPPNGYRYYGDTFYRVDPTTQVIQAVTALLTGETFAIGQPMPAGYDVYNVPYAYRDTYYDTPSADYRYADGYIYQIDPTTRLIQAAIQLTT